MSTNAENLVKIGPALAEIFGGIYADFCRFVPKVSFFPRNLWGYLTYLDQICTGCSKILPFNISKSELR